MPVSPYQRVNIHKRLAQYAKSWYEILFKYYGVPPVPVEFLILKKSSDSCNSCDFLANIKNDMTLDDYYINIEKMYTQESNKLLQNTIMLKYATNLGL